jgi:hypothetical protein
MEEFTQLSSKERKESLLYASQTPKHIRGGIGHNILQPANQLLVMGKKMSSLSNPGLEPATFQLLVQCSKLQRYPGPLNLGNSVQ